MWSYDRVDRIRMDVWSTWHRDKRVAGYELYEIMYCDNKDLNYISVWARECIWTRECVDGVEGVYEYFHVDLDTELVDGIYDLKAGELEDMVNSFLFASKLHGWDECTYERFKRIDTWGLPSIFVPADPRKEVSI